MSHRRVSCGSLGRRKWSRSYFVADICCGLSAVSPHWHEAAAMHVTLTFPWIFLQLLWLLGQSPGFCRTPTPSTRGHNDDPHGLQVMPVNPRLFLLSYFISIFYSQLPSLWTSSFNVRHEGNSLVCVPNASRGQNSKQWFLNLEQGKAYWSRRHQLRR